MEPRRPGGTGIAVRFHHRKPGGGSFSKICKILYPNNMCIDFLKSFFPHCWLVLLDFCKKRDFGYIIKLFLLLFQAFSLVSGRLTAVHAGFRAFFCLFFLFD